MVSDRFAVRQIWRAHRCCVIDRPGVRSRALHNSLLASHSSAGDFSMRRSFLLAGAVLTTLVASLNSANAQQPMQRVQVGILECRGGASIGFIVGSVTNLGCVLRVDGMPEDRYVATIRKVGVDLGITQESALAWGVYAPVAPARARRSLRQLCRCARQCRGWRRCRRQRAGRRFEQFDRATAAQRAGPGWSQCRSRARKSRTSSGTVRDSVCRHSGAMRSIAPGISRFRA